MSVERKSPEEVAALIYEIEQRAKKRKLAARKLRKEAELL